MSGIDWAGIYIGDKVKLGYRGMVSADWAEVEFIDHASMRLSTGWTYLRSESVHVIDHQPAPRKVEVTLGEPLPINPRHYWGTDCPEQTPTTYAAEQTDRAIYLAVGGGPSTILGRGEARRLALDILATTGVEA